MHARNEDDVYRGRGWRQGLGQGREMDRGDEE
jgi:hypothetical protein